MKAQPVRLAVTLGDPTGIGPEVLLRAVAAFTPSGPVELALLGDRGVIDRTASQHGLPPLPPWVTLIEVTALAEAESRPGCPGAASGRAQVAYLEAAMERTLDGLVTAPISKRAAAEAGFAFPGHTEFLAAALHVPAVTMMLAGPRLRVALVTTHLPLARVPAALTVEKVRGTLERTRTALQRDFGLEKPRIAVCGLNPHAGEGGAFGDEEARVIAPAIAALADDAITGPHVPDAVFRQALEGAYDAVVCMYHDQGLIPLKLLDFDEAVNVTLGLPIVRTSPDHGVAYDIAGTGRARPRSMLRALELGDALTRRRAAASP